jgi:hypothetical protein
MSMPGYMVRAFPMLYPYGKADLCSARVKEVKPVEYFKVEIFRVKLIYEVEGITRRANIC